MKSLKGTVLSTFSYSQTQKFCLEHPTLVDCDWDLWRDKAMADFAVSGEFFDLVPQLPGSQRYLQIKSYHVLTPDLAVRVYEDGFIEGVYEALVGYRKAKGDKTMQTFFYNRLPQKLRSLQELLYKPTETLTEESIQALNSNNYHSNYSHYFASAFLNGLKSGRKDADFLYMILETGRIDWLDQVLSRYFDLPKNFSIQKDIPHTPFWAEEFPLYDLPLYQGNLDMNKIASSMVRGSQTRVVDFFRSILRDRLPEKIFALQEHCKLGLSIHKRPEETFGIYMRYRESTLPAPLFFMVEQVMDMGGDPSRFIYEDMGNVTTLLSLVSFVDREGLEKLLEVSDYYPLSTRIIKAYLEG